MEISNSFKRLMRLRDKLVNGGVFNSNMSDGALEMRVESEGFKKTFEYLKSL